MTDNNTSIKVNIFIISLFLSIIAPSISLAQEPMLSKSYPIANAYQGQYRGRRSFQENQQLTQTECFKSANEYIYNSKLQKKSKITIGDPNVLKSQKTIDSTSPDYVSALQKLEQCAIKNNNPVAAWEGVKIITSFIGINYKSNVGMYKNMSEVLYKDKSCDGYINYGTIFLKGISEKPNQIRAKEIFTEGSKVCNSGWQKVVLQMKLANIR